MAMPDDLYHHYLCTRCGYVKKAFAGTVDRTREWRCHSCAVITPANWGDDITNERLRGMVG